MLRIENHELFCHLPEQVLQRLRPCVERRFQKAGREVFREGAPGDGLYWVQSGAVEISTRLSTGERAVLAWIRPGETLGEMAVLDGLPRSATAMAALDTVLGFVPRERLLSVLKESPELVLKLARELSRRLRECNHEHVSQTIDAERRALVGQFARSIVHDLKNPLSILRGATHLLAKPDITPAVRARTEQWIQDQLDQVAETVRDLLEFTHQAAHSPGLVLGSYAKFVEWLLPRLREEPFLSQTPFDCVNRPPPGRLRFNPRRVSRVLLNLLQNAVEAMPAGGPVRLRFQDGQGYVLTEVEDEGPRIAPEAINRAFDPFATLGRAKGSGLGLAVCRQIIEEHGGKIMARNRPEGGAVFSFTLPQLPGVE